MEEQMSDAYSIDAQGKELLATFASDVSSERRGEALTGLIALKLLPKEADHPAITAGREQLLWDASFHKDSRLRLMAIAQSIRLGQVVRRWLPEIKSSLESAFAEELPPLSLLQEADDRLNVARACMWFERSWLPSYLARSVAHEEQGEKARAELIGALLAREETLEDALQALTNVFMEVRPATDTPADSLSRRLTRTLSGLRSRLVDTELETGLNVGKSLNALIARPLSRVGAPQDDKARVELTREILLTVHDVVKIRFSVVTDPDIYQVVSFCRRVFFNSGPWPDELAKPLARLVVNVSEALLLLGRQGKRNQPLRELLSVLCKYPEKAEFIAKNLASRHPELSEDIRYWLATGRTKPDNRLRSAAVDVEAASADPAIGFALEAARSASRAGDRIRERLLASLEIFEPALLTLTRDFLNRAEDVSMQVTQAASLRGIDLFGNIGEEIEVSPKFFDVIGDHPKSRMLVRRPAIVKIRSDGSVGDVLVKGIVE